MSSYTTTFSLKNIQFNFLSAGCSVTAYFTKTLTNDDDETDIATLPGNSIDLVVSDEMMAQVRALATDTHDEKLAEVAATRAASKAASVQLKG